MNDSFFLVLAQSVAIVIFAHFLLKKLLLEKRVLQTPRVQSPPVIPNRPQNLPNNLREFSVPIQSGILSQTTNMTDALLDYADTMPAPVQSESSYRAANELDYLTDVPRAVKIPPPNDPQRLNENLNKLSADSVASLPTAEEDVMNGGIMFDNVTGFEDNSSNFFDLTLLEGSNGSNAYINLTTA